MEKSKYQISVDNTQGLVIGDRNTVIQQFTTNVKSFSADYAIRIQNFLAEYLGTSKNPIPFGGREEDLSHLNNWLSDLHSSPYLLLVAPAGRGKSTLLVRWIEQLQAMKDWIVIFFPISIRFRTNLASVFFSTMTSHIAHLKGKNVPENPDTPIEVWRALFTDYLSQPLSDGCRLLLVLDGLDEAADWEISSDLFPLTPPEGLRIVLSARYLAGDIGTSTWLRRIGWDRTSVAHTLELNPLTLEGVADVLKRMGLPLTSLGLRPDIISELHRLSEGDPLLIRLYVDDLRSRGNSAAHLRAEELRTIHPGLEGYFDSWWKEQRILWGTSAPLREPAVQEFFTLLSCALGPLNKEDVLHLAHSEAKLTSLMLEEVLIPLNRFVIGDGRHQGYTFSHPRLGAYFYEEKLTKRERQNLESRFLSWGSEIILSLNTDEILPDQASSYIVQYYGAHLERTNSSTDRLKPLLSNGWRRAWEALDVTYARFLVDTERVWRVAEKEGEIAASGESYIPHLESEIHCALCQASINSISKVLPSELLVSLVKTKTWTPTQGVAYALLLVDREQKDKSLALLSSFVSKPLETIRMIKSVDWQIEAVKILAETSYLSEALQSTYIIKPISKQMEALISIAPFMTKKQLQEAALRVKATKESNFKNSMLERINFTITEKQLKEAKEAIRTDNQEHRGEQQTIYYERLLNNGLKQAKSFKDRVHQIDALLRLSPYLTEDQKADFLQEIFSESGPRRYNLNTMAESLARFAPHLSKKLLQVALKRALAIENEENLVEVLIALAPQMILTDNLYEIFSRANDIENHQSKARIFVELIPFLPRTLKYQALKYIKDTIQSHDEICVESSEYTEDTYIDTEDTYIDTEDETWGDLRAKIAIRVAESGAHQEALQIARRAIYKEGRIHTLVALVPLLPERLQRKALQEALEIAREAKDKAEQVKSLASLISLLIDKGYSLIALQIAEIMKDRFALTSLSKELTEHGYPTKDIVKLIHGLADLGRFKEALAIVHEIEQVYQTIALTILAAFLPEEFLQEALELGLAIEVSEDQTNMLIALATRFASFGHPRKTLEIARSIKIEMLQEKALATLALELAKLGYLQDALKAAKTIRSDHWRAKCLATLATLLTKIGYPHEAVEIASAMKDKWGEESYVEVIVKLASSLPIPLLWNLLKTVKPINSKLLQTQALIGLIPHLSEKGKREALEILQAMEVDEYQAKALAEIVTSLSKPLIQETFKIVQGMKQEYWRGFTLAKMAARLVEVGLSQETLFEIHEFGSEENQTMVLVKLAPVLPKKRLKNVFSLLSSIREIECRTRILVALIPRSIEEGFLSEFMIEVRKIRHIEYRSKVLIELIPFLLKEHFREIWGKIRQLKRKNYKAKALVDLANQLAQEGYPQSTLEILNKDEEFLGRLASHLAVNYHSLHILEILWMIEDEEFQAKTLENLTEGLAREDCIKEALEATMLIQDVAVKIQATTKLADKLVEKGHPEEALKIVLHIKDYTVGTQAPINLAVKLVREGYPREALETALNIEEDEDDIKGQHMITLILWLVKMGYLQEAQEVLQSLEADGVKSLEREKNRLKALECLASNASSLPLARIYPVWRKILHTSSSRTRQELLVDLAILAPIIFALGNIEAVEKTSRSIMEIGQWWP